MSEPKSKDSWDKIAIFAKLLVPISVAILGFYFNKALKEKDVQAEYVKLASTVLQSQDTSSATKQMKKWAFSLLKKTTPVPMPPELEVNALNLNIDRAKHHTTGGIGGDWGYLEVRADPDQEYYVYIDGQLSATTPSTLNLIIGEHEIEFRDNSGQSIGKTVINLPGHPTHALILDVKSKIISHYELGGWRSPSYKKLSK
jgi:hypothetical protein